MQNTRLNDTQGFSLIEILIALVIIGVMSGLAIMSFGDNKEEALEKEARKLYMLLKQSQDETLLQQFSMGLRMEEDHYVFYVYNRDEGQWALMEDSRMFSEKRIPETFEVKLIVDGNTLFGEDEEDEVDIFDEDVDIFDKKEKELEPPQIFILSSGEMNDFKIALGWTDKHPTYYLIQGNMLGDIELVGPLAGDLNIEVDDEFLQAS